MLGTRLWFWITLVAAVICAAACALAWVDLEVIDSDVWEPSITGAISALFLLGGFAVSLGADAVILRFRKSPVLHVAEVAMLGVLILLIGSLQLTGLEESFVPWDFIAGPIAVLLAIATTIVLGIGNARRPVTTELAQAAFEPTPPTAQPAPPPSASEPTSPSNPYGPAS